MWIHGELRTADGEIEAFRYRNATVEDVEAFSSGSTVIWCEEGFIPEDTSKWGGWGMMEPSEFTQLEVTKCSDTI
jgi:hypothetical protein